MFFVFVLEFLLYLYWAKKMASQKIIVECIFNCLFLEIFAKIYWEYLDISS